ncbi:hypothetical protein Chor_008224 [Crotalus horridus]
MRPLCVSDGDSHELFGQNANESVRQTHPWHLSGELVGDILDDFYTHLIILPLLLEYLKYCLMGLGGLLLIAAGSFGLRTKVGIK